MQDLTPIATPSTSEGQIQGLTSQRDALASQIKSRLDGVAFNGQGLTEQQAESYIAQAQSLLDQAHTLADS